MEFQQKAVLLVIVLLVTLAAYFMLTAEQPVPEEPPEEVDTQAAQELLFKGLEFGKGYDEYVYSYTETSDDYELKYTLTKKGNQSMIEVVNPLATKQVYFLENDTILCTDYPGEVICSSVHGSMELENYLESLHVKFLDDNRITKEQASMSYLIANGYVRLDPEIETGTMCSKITYVLDFTGLTLAEAAQFGISSNSPKVFDWQMCINNETGYMHYKKFNYTVGEVTHYYTYNLVSFQPSAPDIEAPLNITTGAINHLRNERKQTIELAKCFTDKQGAERDKCVSITALSTKRKDLCDFARERRDRCLVSLIPVTKDESICPVIADPGYKDDCYIELAGAYNDESYCDSIQNVSKVEQCTEAATPPPPKNESEDDYEVDIDEFMEYVEGLDKDGPAENETAGNETNEST